jgi:biopolymer transport protein ExbD
MNKKITNRFELLQGLLVLPVVCGIVFANACARQPSLALSSPPAAQSSAAKVKLNGEDVGTTEDTSVLVRRFTEIRDQRTKKAGNFFIRAEIGLRFSEVFRVVEALSHARGIADLAFEVDAASAASISRDPVLLPYDPVESAGVSSHTFPRAMMLVVTVGSLGSPRGELISEAMQLFLTPFTMRFAARHSVPKGFVVVEVFKDNEYVIGDKPIFNSAIKGDLQTRLSKNQDKRVMIQIRSDSEIRWGSFMEVANAAREAGADMIQILILTP